MYATEHMSVIIIVQLIVLLPRLLPLMCHSFSLLVFPGLATEQAPWSAWNGTAQT